VAVARAETSSVLRLDRGGRAFFPRFLQWSASPPPTDRAGWTTSGKEFPCPRGSKSGLEEVSWFPSGASAPC